MRFPSVTILCVLFTAGLFAQTDRGTITGTVLDPANAAIAGATVVARGVDSGSQYQTATTATGNYTLASLPAGVYEVSIESAGFKKFTQQGIAVQVAQTIRIDFVLQLGATSESITVTAAAPLLKTENAEQSTTISRDSLTKLPLNFGAVQSGAIRNALAFVALSPGAYIQPGSQNTIRVNGTPNISFKIMLEGQDATNGITQATSNHLSPSVDAVEEFTLQSSNFAAEFGQVVGGLFNFTARSGTNQYHGGAYDYLVNDAFNAGQPFTDDGHGHLVRPAAKKNDAGITVGGPLSLPKLYNGRNRTFFFLGVEGYVDRKRSQSTGTVPTDAMRNGDFSAILTGRNLAADPLGRPIMENTVYDPATQRLANGQVIRDAFPGNIIPKNLIDPVAAKIQAYIPTPTSPGLVNNWTVFGLAPRNQVIQSLKVDHSFHSTSKLSFYSQYYRDFEFNSSPDGLPAPITTHREKHIYTYTARLNYDQSITPTTLLHAGIGEQRLSNPDTSPKVVTNFDELGQLGLVGGAANPSGFPRITGLNSTLGGFSVSNQGSIGMGPTNLGDHYFTDKPTVVLNLTHVRGSHTYKAGGEFRIDTFTQITRKGQSGNFVFSGLETGLPATLGQNLGGGAVGFPYASFLLGAVDSATVNSPQDPQLRKKSWSFFAQDTWKIMRKLTLDYGIRYDLQGQGDEIHNRLSEFSPTTPNPSAGGRPGATIYEGSGQGRCNCIFTKRYPYAFGPRLGIAYQINSKTVFRGGWGIAYGPTPEYNYLGSTAIVGVGGYNQISFTSPSYGDPAAVLRNGLRYDPAALYSSSLNPGIRPNPGQIDSPPYWIDPNGGRPPRVMQWSLGLQRQITGDLMLEAAYVGNRGAWEEANSLIDLNGLTPQRIASAGLDINSAADRTLLTSRLDSAAAQSRGFKAPYTGYPLSLTVAQTLRPFPQFGNISVWWAPVGNNWYDSLQAKVTKRTSHGLTATLAFTWQKELASGADGGPVNDVYNRSNQKIISPSSQPLVAVTGFAYQLQPWGVGKWMKAAVRDWTLGGILRYSSGMPIQVPAANNALSSLLFRGTFANRVAGQPLFLQDLNCHCFDPNTAFVLNPKAWADPAAGQWGTSAAYYNDYRLARRPDESLSMGRIFRIREGMSFQVRAEFFNPFNRIYLNNPDSTNAGAAQKVTNGQIVSGFGRISTGTTFLAPRNGQVIARFTW